MTCHLCPFDAAGVAHEVAAGVWLCDRHLLAIVERLSPAPDDRRAVNRQPVAA